MRRLFTLAAAALVLAPAATATASTTSPPRWHLIGRWSGRAMLGWQHTLFGDQCSTPGSISVTRYGRVALTTSGTPGNCAEIAAPRTFAPTGKHPLLIEARVRFPVTGGKIPNWPAFWVSVPSWKVWPLDGEIDVAEGLAGDSSWPGGVCATYHWSTNGIPPGVTAPIPQPGVGSTVSTCQAPAAGWHTYSVLWRPRSLSFFYDGQHLITYRGPEILHKPLSLIFDNTTGWPGGQGASAVLVAWAGVWRLR